MRSGTAAGSRREASAAPRRRPRSSARSGEVGEVPRRGLAFADALGDTAVAGVEALEAGGRCSGDRRGCRARAARSPPNSISISRVVHEEPGGGGVAEPDLEQRRGRHRAGTPTMSTSAIQAQRGRAAGGRPAAPPPRRQERGGGKTSARAMPTSHSSPRRHNSGASGPPGSTAPRAGSARDDPSSGNVIAIRPKAGPRRRDALRGAGARPDRSGCHGTARSGVACPRSSRPPASDRVAARRPPTARTSQVSGSSRKPLSKSACTNGPRKRPPRGPSACARGFITAAIRERSPASSRRRARARWRRARRRP